MDFYNILKKKAIHDYDIPTSIQEFCVEYEPSLFFKDIYNCINKSHVLLW